MAGARNGKRRLGRLRALLAPVLGRELGRLRELGELRCILEVTEKLGQILAKMVDRLLGREEQVRHFRPDRNPVVHPPPHQKIPVTEDDCHLRPKDCIQTTAAV